MLKHHTMQVLTFYDNPVAKDGLMRQADEGLDAFLAHLLNACPRTYAHI